ncbi:leucine-rich repeat-containing protein 7 [Trichonephila clavipes]|nr:leucine-rich repeat-containing protein 7 [Trichonephila clavipes]
MAPVLRHCPCLRPESDDVRLLEYSHSNLDDVPNEVFGYERTLEELFLDANQIKDLPRPLFHCHGLRKLNLSDNEVQTLPPAIASLINLEHLDISKNGILEIPESIKGCKCLTVIDASVNPLGNCQVIYSQFGLAIHQNDHQARRRFIEWAQNEIPVVPDFHKRILFSDEAHFWLNGYVNKQNFHIWSEANPQVYIETPLHPEKLTVWCALWAGGILLQKR